VRSASRVAAPTLLVFVLGLAACGGPSPAPAASPSRTLAGTPAAIPTSAAEPTAVPGGGSAGPSRSAGPAATPPPTTRTDWGVIVDGLPDGFPVFPGAEVADPQPTAVSGAFLASAGVGEVAAWYRVALEAIGKSTVNLSSPLEDGSRVLDMKGNPPECMLQLTFRPEGGSTMITVLYGAGCAGQG
jgi:hypothetical protein